LKPWKKVQWVIAPEASGEFVVQMERVLDVYKRGHDPRRPVVCMDESPRQLIRETRAVQAVAPGRAERHDYEYERCGVCNVFRAVEPLAGQRLVRVTERKTKTDWAVFLQEIAGRWSRAEKITLIMDNLNTHGPGSLYETFAPAHAKTLWDRFEFVYTPKHGSWLNMAEVELNVLSKTVPEPSDRHHGRAARGSRGLATRPRQRRREDRLAVLMRKRPHQTQTPLSDNYYVT
jgi:hypothetical protein